MSNATETAILMHGMGNRIAGCEIRGCGRSGIRLSGGDLKTLTCSGSVVERCRISDFGALYRTYAPGIDAIGVGLTFRGNEIFNAPHAAVLYTGNEMLFEDNDVHHVLLETADAGAFYTGRRLTTCGNVLRWNFVHELGSGSDNADTMGFYFDDCDCGDAVYGNVFWKCARGIMIGGGREHPVVGNVFAACRYGLSIDARGLTLKDKWEKWGLVKEAESLGYREEPWRSKYPRLANILNDSPREPLYNSVISNVFVDCQEKLLFLDGKPEVMDPLVPKIPVCGNVVLTSAKGTKSPTPDPRVAAGFAVMDDPAEDWFRAPASGDFSPGRAPKRLLDIGPRWRRRSQRGGGRMSDEVQKP